MFSTSVKCKVLRIFSTKTSHLLFSEHTVVSATMPLKVEIPYPANSETPPILLKNDSQLSALTSTIGDDTFSHDI